MTQPPSTNELRERLMLIPTGFYIDTATDELIGFIVAQTGWDFEHTKAVFLANFATDLK